MAGRKVPARPEVLAPAGSAEMLRAAVLAGADAVYLGFAGFNARKSAGNFTAAALCDAVAFCHARGVKVHVALNTLVFGPELAGLADAVRAVAAAGADAVIADDLAAGVLVKAIAPGLALHASTQMSIHTPAGVRQLAEMGYDRAILARELSLDEIREICAASPIEVEVFVHGAMCMSMSGQCMMSAFLGGRSGNRGDCAGPCRLPFDATPGLPAGRPGRACHLSLKEMDLVPHIRALADAGVASVKIEGRLRTPEYAAVAAAACCAARDGRAYDAALLAGIFSRSGFSDGYLTGKTGREMFGVRTEADAAATRAALPKARALFRNEMPRVPVGLTLRVAADGAKLTAEDGEGHRSVRYYLPPEGPDGAEGALPPAENDPVPALEKKLAKTGGTPFYPARCTVTSEGGPWFLPGSAVNELRRAALDELLQKRSAPAPKPVRPYALPAPQCHPAGAVRGVIARFETVSQIPPALAADPSGVYRLVLPLGQAGALPEGLRGVTLLELPRAAYGRAEAEGIRALAQVGGGWAGVVLNNLGQFQWGTPLPKFAGLGLNVTNPLAAGRLAALGVRGLLIHPETALAAMAAVAPGAETAALVYGHIPLMLTRACPLQNVRSCAGCTGRGSLRDRKGRDFPVRCTAPGPAGVRRVYNPVPLYMGDRLAELPADYAVAAFTIETPEQAAQILARLARGAAFDGEFTRGAYY